MIDTDKFEGHTEGPWEQYSAAAYHAVVLPGDIELIPPKLADAQLIADAPLLLAEVKRLRDGIRSILSDYDITELIRDVPEDEWNFEQQALIRMKEMIE